MKAVWEEIKNASVIVTEAFFVENGAIISTRDRKRRRS